MGKPLLNLDPADSQPCGIILSTDCQRCGAPGLPASCPACQQAMVLCIHHVGLACADCQKERVFSAAAPASGQTALEGGAE